MRMPKEKECPLCGYDTSGVNAECVQCHDYYGHPDQAVLIWKCLRCGYRWIDKPAEDLNAGPGVFVEVRATEK